MKEECVLSLRDEIRGAKHRRKEVSQYAAKLKAQLDQIRDKVKSKFEAFQENQKELLKQINN